MLTKMNNSIFDDLYDIKDSISDQQFINLNNKASELIREINKTERRDEFRQNMVTLIICISILYFVNHLTYKI